MRLGTVSMVYQSFKRRRTQSDDLAALTSLTAPTSRHAQWSNMKHARPPRGPVRSNERRTSLDEILQDQTQSAANSVVGLPDDLRIDPDLLRNFDGAVTFDGDL